MDEELERDLVDSYPDIFAVYDIDPEANDTPTPAFALYGFECGNGWYDIIDSLCAYINRTDADVTVSQVKEKFGGLRFYHNGIQADSEREMHAVSGAIQQAQEMSFRVCETCGCPAEQSRENGWIRTRCDDCLSA